MKTTTPSIPISRTGAWAFALGLAFVSIGCVDTYDSSGRPVQTVDPAVAVAGAAAAGVTGYAIGQRNRSRSNQYYGHGGGYYRPHYRSGPARHRGYRY